MCIYFDEKYISMCVYKIKRKYKLKIKLKVHDKSFETKPWFI